MKRIIFVTMSTYRGLYSSAIKAVISSGDNVEETFKYDVEELSMMSMELSSVMFILEMISATKFGVTRSMSECSAHN